MTELVWCDGRWWEKCGEYLYYVFTREEVIEIGGRTLAELRAKSDTIENL
jgi:hypothetical protein